MFPVSADSAYDSVVYMLVKTKLLEAEAEGKTNHNARSCTFVIGLFHSLLLVTPTTKFSLDRKWQSCKQNQNAVFTTS